MELQGKKIGVAFTGSFCTYQRDQRDCWIYW